MPEHKDRQIKEANDLQDSIKRIVAERESVESEVKSLEGQQQEVMAAARELQSRAGQINSELQSKAAALRQIKQAMYVKESEYMAFLEAQPTLAHVMRGGAH
mmetsp:Transcript_68084/g.197295  ORF Transcript_68084/g.197295 Transcript_68084/m.197295 type:complete len:102 (-) Transcript_68084:194-499(-)